MRYRLAFAQALLGRPDLLVLDEPTTGLDPVHMRDVRDAVAEVARRGATVLLSSHLMSEVEQVCSHAAVMQEGKILAFGTVSELVSPGRTLERAYLDLVSRAPSARVGDLEVA
jgi:ABC-2 type transport system ATP-binding protein